MWPWQLLYRPVQKVKWLNIFSSTNYWSSAAMNHFASLLEHGATWMCFSQYHTHKDKKTNWKWPHACTCIGKLLYLIAVHLHTHRCDYPDNQQMLAIISCQPDCNGKWKSVSHEQPHSSPSSSPWETDAHWSAVSLYPPLSMLLCQSQFHRTSTKLYPTTVLPP